MERKFVMRGKSREEYFKFFVEMGGRGSDKKTVIGPNWVAVVGDEKSVRIGALDFPETEIIIGYTSDEILDKFKLRFLTAGG
ncbi:hypothetical protein [Alkalibacter mobilis]|uniref:hypothetical protein n=1 Tax=Alkalibacter mobilis TaxID=2787712 RepID=UPI00189F9DBE|nr:hypothetical protein [Alkalibacter mobilis]MBF7096972.1 hypothetical protein [Alkalibacter mobilis]